jgi:cytochrome c biogenesis protein CcmG, thiol:disulfide interchange protein DsbE
MRSKAVFSALLIVLFAAAYAKKSPAQDVTNESGGVESLAVGSSTMAPDFIERDITDRQTISLHDYRGKVVMLNFWGTWCPPCRAEVPDLKALQRTHKDTLEIIGAAVFSSEAAVDKFYQDYKINYPIIFGSYELMEKYGKISVIPTTVIIDRKGAIAGTIVGSRTREQYEQMLKPLLAR